MKLIIGLILAVCVGIGCRFFGIPLPGPPAIMGAAMAVAMATGYTATDHWLMKATTSKDASVTSSPHSHETSSVAAGTSNSELP